MSNQAPLSIAFLRQEYWSGLPFPPSGNLSELGIKPASPALAGRFFTTEPPRNPKLYMGYMHSFHRKWLQSRNLTQDEFSYLFISGHITRSPLPCPEHEGAADAGGKAEGGRQGCRHPGECSRGPAEVQPQVLTMQ